MNSVLVCPTCKTQLRIDPSQKAPAVRCPKCLGVVSVPGSSETPAHKAKDPKPSIALAKVTKAAQGTADRQTASNSRSVIEISHDQQRRGPFKMLLVAAKWLALMLALLLSLLAAALPLYQPANAWLTFATGGVAIFVGSIAVGLLIATRSSMMESAAAAVFLGIAAVLFALNLAMSANITKAASIAIERATAKENDLIAKESELATKEGEIRQERERAEDARSAAANMLKKAEDAPVKAQAILKAAEEAEATASEAPLKAAQLLAETKAEKAMLDKKRDQIAAQTDALNADRVKVEDAKAKLEDQARQIEAMKKEVAAFAKQAETDKLQAKELAEKAEQKEQDALGVNKKVQDAIEAVKLKLKAKTPQERKAAIGALARIGAIAKSADYDLCEVVAFDTAPELRRAALDAIAQVQPKLHPLVVTLSLPPESYDLAGYKRAIQQLPTFGRAGLPLITAQLQGMNPHISGSFAASSIVIANASALAKIAHEDEAALSLLLKLPGSVLATNSNSYPINSSIHEVVGRHLIALANTKPELRKKFVPFFVERLGSSSEAHRLLAAEALADFGPDAADALPTLKKMGLDPAERVRAAVSRAISKIEKADN